MNKFVKHELKPIIQDRSIWWMLGIQDIKNRYRNSALGPFWITINMAVTICCMAFLYGHLFKVPIKDYLPYLSGGIICWTFLSTLIMESSTAFIEAECFIRNQAFLSTIFLMRVFLRNFFIFLHNLIVFIIVIFLFNIPINVNTIYFIPGLLLLCLNTIFWGTFLSTITTRYRDFSPIINSLIQIAFFSSPVMWMPKLLPEKYQWLIQYNPFAQFLNIIRSPLMGEAINLNSIELILFITILGFFVFIIMTNKYKDRIVFWL